MQSVATGGTLMGFDRSGSPSRPSDSPYVDDLRLPLDALSPPRRRGGAAVGRRAAGRRAKRAPPDSLSAELHWDHRPLGLPEEMAVPPENPPSEAKVRLGRRLFFDARLSADGSLACASCHDPRHGMASPDRVAIGVGGAVGTRNAPSILNRGFAARFFWDGRSPTLEEQALEPIENPLELASSVESSLQRLRSDAQTVELFRQAFAEEDPEAAPAEVVTATHLAQAIASFERTLNAGNSRVDRFRSAEYAALDARARRGMWLFESRGGCWQCHNGPLLSDDDFHNTGVSFGRPDRDVGRSRISGDEADRFRFKTPSLRGVAQTAPYMHDGSIATLAEVIEFYDRGGAPDDPMLDPKMKPLDLSPEDRQSLVDFLQALSNDSYPTAAAAEATSSDSD